MKFIISAVAIAAHIPGKQGRNGKPVSGARVRYMLRNPERGDNRARLTAALLKMGLTNEGAEMFIGCKTVEK